MYPNPQDVLPLPPHPDLEQYKKRAKDLVKACRSNDGDSFRNWAAHWIDDLSKLQLEPVRMRKRDREQQIEQITDFAAQQLTRNDCTLASAQFVLARAHGFASWPRFQQHLHELAATSSRLSAFERAADAIVMGDIATLRQLLGDHPDLVHARSRREHRATLLHYVSANGVENYRQKTPANIVEVTRILLNAGAEVNAEADVYGGGANTLGLVVTSAHPRLASVQNQLADLLLERGARIDNGIVRSCLGNGCPEAGEHMARRGASLDLEEAAGIGRLDVVQQHFNKRGAAALPTSDEKVIAALIMAAWYNQRDVIQYLLDQGIDPGARLPRQGDGQSALHVAAYQAHVELVDLLLQRSAPVNLVDETHGTTPLVWALHAWLVDDRGSAEDYRQVLKLLVEAGAHVQRDHINDDRLRADPELFALLTRAANTQV
jgi:ankyrin repeat protein